MSFEWESFESVELWSVAGRGDGCADVCGEACADADNDAVKTLEPPLPSGNAGEVERS